MKFIKILTLCMLATITANQSYATEATLVNQGIVGEERGEPTTGEIHSNVRPQVAEARRHLNEAGSREVDEASREFAEGVIRHFAAAASRLNEELRRQGAADASRYLNEKVSRHFAERSRQGHISSNVCSIPTFDEWVNNPGDEIAIREVDEQSNDPLAEDGSREDDERPNNPFDERPNNPGLEDNGTERGENNLQSDSSEFSAGLSFFNDDSSEYDLFGDRSEYDLEG